MHLNKVHSGVDKLALTIRLIVNKYQLLDGVTWPRL